MEQVPQTPYRDARIFLVDDEALNVELISRMLEEAGYRQIQSVTDPREALEQFTAFQPDIVLQDLRMPHVDGFMLLQRLRATIPPEVFLPIVVLTADWTPEARHRALSCGASDFLTRPIDSSELLLRVGNLLSTRLLQRQLFQHNETLETTVRARTAELLETNEQLRHEAELRQRAEESLRRHTAFVHLLEVITVAASQSAPVHQTLQVALDQVCQSTQWPVGHALKRNSSGHLVSAGLWHYDEPMRYAALRASSEQMDFPTGVGLPGRVLASGQPAWIANLDSDINFRRSEVARDLGLTAGFALPVLVGNEVGAVLEFFSNDPTPPDAEMLEVMHHIGAQLGRVLERQRSEEALRSSEAKFRSLVQLGTDGIVLADSTGRILCWNHGAQQIFGYAEDEALGRSLLMLIPERFRSMATGMDFLGQPGLHRLVGRMMQVEGLRKDGSEFPMELAVDLWTTWDGTFCSAIIRDVTERKAMEESLRQSEERLRGLLEATKVIPWTLDLGEERVTYVGPQIVSLLGYGLEQWHTPGFWAAHLHPEDRDWAVRYCVDAVAGHPAFEFECRMIAADGHQVWLQYLVTASGGERKTISGFLLDISLTKQRQNSLRHYAAAVESSNDAIICASLDSKVLSWNKGAERLYGYAAGEMIGRTANLLIPDGATENDPPFNLLAQAAPFENLETILRRKDGTVVDVALTASAIRDLHGRVMGVCTIGRDVSERKRAEAELRRSHEHLEGQVAQRTTELQAVNSQLRLEIGERQQTEAALRASENRLKMLISSIEEIVFEFDPDGRYLNVWSWEKEPIDDWRSELLGSSVADQLGEALALPLIETFRRVIASGRPETMEHTLDLPEGRRWCLSRIAPLTDVNGVRRSVCLLARDISERKMIEEQLRLAKEESERANSAKTEFLSRMSHELRTPLNAILGFAQLLDRERLSDDDREGVDQILHAGHHLLGLINEVLDMARIEVGRLTLEIETVRCGDILQEALSLVRPLAAAREVTLVDEVPELPVLADRKRLMQIYLNLLSNGIKYNREQGTLTITATAHEHFTRVAFKDTGRGVTPEQAATLFQPFERLDSSPGAVEGIGLGLAISKRLVELMGGEIGVESDGQDGSTFWLTLPTAVEGEEVSAEAVLPAPAVPLGRPYTILYIEDNLSNLKLVERIVSRQRRIQLLAATRGLPGFNLAVTHQPAVILLDLRLPDIHGEDLLVRLRSDERTARIPVIVTSADANPEIIARLYRAGAKGFLSKPLDVNEFFNALTKVLGEESPEALEATGPR